MWYEYTIIGLLCVIIVSIWVKNKSKKVIKKIELSSMTYFELFDIILDIHKSVISKYIDENYTLPNSEISYGNFSTIVMDITTLTINSINSNVLEQLYQYITEEYLVMHLTSITMTVVRTMIRDEASVIKKH